VGTAVVEERLSVSLATMRIAERAFGG